ncbi:MAG: HEAT repeat domain-containing protein [Snowella sp.]|nr:HEAT repeat domain-containing protein [Snowella sp.]
MALNKKYLEMAINACVEKLADSDPQIRAEAAKTLGKLGSGEAIPFLCQSLGTETTKDVIFEIMNAFTIIHNSGSNQPMPENPKYNFPNAQNVQIVEQTDGGDVIAHNYASSQNLAEAATEIQNLLDKLPQEQPLTSQIVQQEIQQNSDFKTKLTKSLTAGSIETIKIIFTPLGIPIEMLKAWLEIE